MYVYQINTKVRIIEWFYKVNFLRPLSAQLIECFM